MPSYQRSTRLGFAAFAILFLAVLGAGPAFAGEAPQTGLPAATASLPAATHCGSSFDLTSLTVQAPICPAAQPESLAPELMAKPPRHGYCICGCGATCTSDADCGGSQCVSFITCC
jgi:hypothetical protein